MTKTVLLTSFVSWKPWQASNSADDLLQNVLCHHPSPELIALRGLPVNLPVARDLTIAKIQQLQPQVILLCGMAEMRQKLSLESTGILGDCKLHTQFDLQALTDGLALTDISHDAGRFVCNSLYYFILDYLKDYCPNCFCLFVHVPVLTASNRAAIAADFRVVLERVMAIE